MSEEQDTVHDANADAAEATLQKLLEEQHKIVQHHLDDPLIRATAPGRSDDANKFSDLENKAKKRRRKRIVVDPTVRDTVVLFTAQFKSCLT